MNDGFGVAVLGMFCAAFGLGKTKLYKDRSHTLPSLCTVKGEGHKALMCIRMCCIRSIIAFNSV